MVVTGLDDARGGMVYEITLGRGELEKASKDGLKIPRDKLRNADDVVINVGPDMEMGRCEGVAKMVDVSANKRIQAQSEED